MRTIKAVFEIQEDSTLAGVQFKIGNKIVHWDKLSRQEQIRMLNAWSGHWKLFREFLKEKDDETRDS